MATITTSAQTAASDTPATWSYESATAAQRALNPIANADATPNSSPQLHNQFPVEQVLTRTVILRNPSKIVSPKRTSSAMPSGAKKIETMVRPAATGGARSKSIGRTKPTVCSSTSCRLGKKPLSPRADAVEESAGKGDLQEERMRFDRCAGVDTTERTREFKRTIFSKIAEESFKVRRVRRKKAKPAPFKGKVKTTKAAQLRSKFIRNHDVSSSLTEQHIKKYRKPPFKTVGVLRMCYEKLSEKLEKLKIRKNRPKSPAKRKANRK